MERRSSTRDEPAAASHDRTPPDLSARGIVQFSARVPSLAVLATAILLLCGVASVGGLAAADGPPAFETSTVTVAEGEDAMIGVNATDAESLTLVVGNGTDSGYELRAAVAPADDGAILRFDHAAAGDGDGDVLTAVGCADVTVESETDLDAALDAGTYELRLLDVDGDVVDVGSVVVESASDADGADDEASSPGPVSRETVDDADAVVRPETDREIAVPTVADDGDEVIARLRSTGQTDPSFIMTEEATVADGTAVATFDLSAVPHGATATATARSDGNDGTETTVLVIDPNVGIEGDVTLADVETRGDAVDGDEAADDESDSDDGGASTGEPDLHGDSEEDLDGTDDEVPGFGVALTTLAVLAMALLATRHQNIIGTD